jgi:hypothetical protein
VLQAAACSLTRIATLDRTGIASISSPSLRWCVYDRRRDLVNTLVSLRLVLGRSARAKDARPGLFRIALWWAYAFVVAVAAAYFFGITRGELPALFARSRMYAGDLAVTGSILLAAFGIGGWVLAWLHLDRAEALGLVYAVLTGLGVLALSILGLGVAGLLYWPTFVVLLVGGACLAILRRNSWGLARYFAKEMTDAADQIRSDGVSALAAIAGTGGIVYSALTNAMVPPVEWDTIAYHLAIPELYLQSHRITYIPSILHSNWPFNMEMLYTLALAIGSERSPGFITLSFLVIGALTLVLAGMRFFTARVGILAAAFYAGLPVVHRYAGTGDVDVPLAVFAFVAALAWYEGVTRSDKALLVLAGLLSGFAAGCKLTGVVTAVILGVGLIVVAIAQRKMISYLPVVVAFAVPAGLVVVPWYLKSWIVTGNPVWPFLVNVFPSRNWDRYGEALLDGDLHSPGTGTSLRSLVWLPWDLSVSTRFGGAPLGPLMLVAGPISLLTRQRRSVVFYLVCFCVAETLIWFYQTQQLRFLSPVLLALSILAAVGVARVFEMAPRAGRVLCALALAVWFILEFPLVVTPERAAVDASLPYVRGQMDEKAFLAQRIDAFPVFEYANTHLPGDAYIFLLLYEDRGFYLHRAYFWGNPISQRVLRFEQIGSAAELDQKLRTMGFTYVIVNPNWDLPNAPYAKHFHQLVADYTARYLQPLFSANGVTLYRVHP